MNKDVRSVELLQRPAIRETWRSRLLIWLGLAAVAFASHGAALTDGLFFDDHWHRVTLRDRGWGFNELVESATFDLPGELTTLWWQDQPLQWRYARPVAMLAMKIEYILTGGEPVGVHLCGVLWHLATGVLVYHLAMWVFGVRLWAFVAGALFLLNPHSVFAVGWTAARNALVSGFFVVASVLMYTKASLDGAGPIRWRYLVATVVMWVLALFSRETAIVVPAIIVGLDLTVGGFRHLWRRVPVHLVIWAMTAGYLFWRLTIFPTSDAPNIYFTNPGGPAYVLWAASKLLQMLFGIAFYTPMFMGLSTYKGLGDGLIAIHIVMAVMMALVAWWYTRASRGLKGRWLWPGWVVVSLLPIVPVFIMPHFAYLPFIAWSIFLATLLSRSKGAARIAVVLLIVGGSIWCLALYRMVWRGICRSEQVVYADIVANTPPPKPGATVCFVNLPISAIYAPVALRDMWGVEDLTGYVLTFAPHPLMMTQPSVVQRVGDRDLIVATDAPGYFSGIAGHMLTDGMHHGGQLTQGSTVPGELFDTTILEADEAGIRKLKFSFHQPIDSENTYIYVSTPDRPARRLEFAAETGVLDRRDVVPVPADMLAQRDLYFTVMNAAGRILKSELLLTKPTTAP